MHWAPAVNKQSRISGTTHQLLERSPGRSWAAIGDLDMSILLLGRNIAAGSSLARRDGEIIGAGSRGVRGSPLGLVRITGPLSCTKKGVAPVSVSLLCAARVGPSFPFYPFFREFKLPLRDCGHVEGRGGAQTVRLKVAQRTARPEGRLSDSFDCFDRRVICRYRSWCSSTTMDAHWNWLSAACLPILLSPVGCSR